MTRDEAEKYIVGGLTEGRELVTPGLPQATSNTGEPYVVFSILGHEPEQAARALVCLVKSHEWGGTKNLYWRRFPEVSRVMVKILAVDGLKGSYPEESYIYHASCRVLITDKDPLEP